MGTIRGEGVEEGGQRVAESRQRREEIRQRLIEGAGVGTEAGVRFVQGAGAVIGHHVEVPLRFTPVQRDDSQQVLLLLRAEVVDLARHLTVDVARVDHQHLVAARLGFGAVEKPQLARHGAGIKKVGANGNHDVRVAGFHQLPAYLGLAAACAGRLGRHDETGPPRFIQVPVEVADPDVVAVADLAFLVDARQAEGQTRVGCDLAGVDLVHVERGIGHHVVRLAQQFVRVLVVRDRLPDVAFEAVDGKVHPGQTDGGGVLLQAAEGEPLGGSLAVLRHGAGTLDEHAAGSARRVEHRAALGVQHVGNQRHQRDGGEKFAAVVGFLVGELGEEVFVDATKDVAGHPLQLIGIEGAQ